MKIQYASDLHLEFRDNERYLGSEPLIPSADVLVLAGDIVPFNQMDDFKWFFNFVSENFKVVYWVPGNHEYYHSDLAEQRGTLYEAVRPNVFLVNNYAVTIEDVRLIFATLWTNIKPIYQIQIERGMNDFHLIKLNGARLTAEDLNSEHATSLAFIEYELLQQTPGIRKMVVTHHVPTFVKYPPKYLGSVLNQAFAVDLDKLLIAIGPDYWLFGHHHQNIAEFTVGKTKLITNQLGYVQAREHLHFDEAKVLEI
jgi:predicted phosphohydrolase